MGQGRGRITVEHWHAVPWLTKLIAHVLQMTCSGSTVGSHFRQVRWTSSRGPGLAALVIWFWSQHSLLCCGVVCCHISMPGAEVDDDKLVNRYSLPTPQKS